MSKLWSLSLTLVTALFSALVLPGAALAAAGHPTIPGSELSAVWVIPFACMLLSIAIMPLALPHFWEHHFGKIAVFWGLAFLVPCLLVYGFNVALYEFLHIILLDYIPFIVLLFALFTVAGGVRLKGSLVGTPVVNTLLLAVGTVLASWMGTTGAAMLLIRPLLRANAHRKYRVHSVVFFIFLVANIGGSLTPALPGLPQGRQLLLDHHPSFPEDSLPLRGPAGDLLCAGHGAFQQGRPPHPAA